MVTMHYRKLTVRGENVRIGDILPSGDDVRRIVIESNETRLINGEEYPNKELVPIQRVSPRGPNPRRVNWDHRISDFFWLVDGGTSLERAMRQVAPDLKPVTWYENLKRNGQGEMATRVLREVVKNDSRN